MSNVTATALLVISALLNLAAAVGIGDGGAVHPGPLGLVFATGAALAVLLKLP